MRIHRGLVLKQDRGFRKLAQIGEKINGIYVYDTNIAIVHSKTKLFEWSNFPNQPDTEHLTELFNDMNDRKSCFNRTDAEKKLYINDGKNYLVYDGTVVKKVTEDNPIIPRTTISRKAGNVGGGELLEDVNVLTPKRTNSFLADGEAKDFYLDATEIDDTLVTAIVNDVQMNENTDFLVDRLKGKVTFNEVPSKPNLSGEDNVFITFSKTIEGYSDRIAKCTNAIIFDGRLFFSGNPDFPNAIFHTERNSPQYVADLNYYEDGASDSLITGMTVGNNILWVFKNLDQNNANVFYHEPTTDLEHGRIYPSKQGNVSIGCYAGSTNFQDDIVYLSRYGLEGVSVEKIDSRQVVSHRSSLVDVKMTNENGYADATMVVWKGYLCILVDGRVYLADSRQKYAKLDSFEYEWFFWDISSSKPNILKEYDDSLYIGASDGSIFIAEGTNDNQETILSYWTTPMDNFGFENQLKTTNKRGGIAKVKTIPNGLIKVARRTDKSPDYKFTTQKSANGFNFNYINFANFSFVTTDKLRLLYKIKEKKIVELSLKFYSDEKDKPFGIYSATIEAFAGGYVKK